MAWRWRTMRPASSTNTGMRQRRAQEIHRKHYRVIDVPAGLAWSVAAEASPWVANSIWASR